MKDIHTAVEIDAPAELVWEIVADLESWSLWNPIMRGEGRFALDEEVAITIAPPGAEPIVITPRIVHFDAGKEIRWLRRLAVPGLFDSEHGLRISASDEARCRFENFEIFRGLISGLMMRGNDKVVQMGFVAMNRALRREAERRAQA